MALTSSHSSAAVQVTPIPASLLRFPPDSQPTTLSAPSNEATLSHPFPIPSGAFNALLSVEIPIAAVIIYVTSVVLLNQFNGSRNYKPWAVSQTSVFQGFIVAHNIFLALFSAWTLIGMINAVVVSLNGVVAENGFIGVVDALCKINGPRGLGSAATFDSSTSSWGIKDRTMNLLPNGTPNTTDVGRMWNEGLAFYGWFFYLSKFYEVMDTLIILARGKRSSFLQTYHHAGVIICMWAGIRYMAPPVWMFVLINSFVHVLMVIIPFLKKIYLE